MKNEENYDVVIIGAGVSGTALLYMLSRYTDINSMAIIEKYGKVAEVNSNSKSNSQTLHFGDIETNYDLEKAKRVKEAAEMVANYLERNEGKENIYKKFHKMALAVGKEEAGYLKQRYEEFKEVYPKIKLIGREELSQLEPNVIKGRKEDEEVAAIFTEDGYTVNYGKLSASFLEDALKEDKKRIDTYFSTEIQRITPKPNGEYEVETHQQKITAKIMVVSAGAYSLYFAKQLGYGKGITLMSVAGNFYFTPKMLNGKVYTCQMRKLPFAAIHGDPDLDNLDKTRFGPTAEAILLLERRNLRSMGKYLKVLLSEPGSISSIISILLDRTYFMYGLKNLFYPVPFFGRWLFSVGIRKIIPSVKLKDIEHAKCIGGARPQIVNIEKKAFEMGEAKLIGKNIIFNITPSPGATKCMKNAQIDAVKVIEFFKGEFTLDHEKLKKELID